MELGKIPPGNEPYPNTDAAIIYSSDDFYEGTIRDLYEKNTITYKNYNKVNSSDIRTVNFYTSNLDIDDNVLLDINYLYVSKRNCVKYNIPRYGWKEDTDFINARFPANLNAIEQTGINVK